MDGPFFRLRHLEQDRRPEDLSRVLATLILTFALGDPYGASQFRWTTEFSITRHLVFMDQFLPAGVGRLGFISRTLFALAAAGGM